MTARYEDTLTFKQQILQRIDAWIANMVDNAKGLRDNGRGKESEEQFDRAEWLQQARDIVRLA